MPEVLLSLMRDVRRMLCQLLLNTNVSMACRAGLGYTGPNMRCTHFSLTKQPMHPIASRCWLHAPPDLHGRLSTSADSASIPTLRSFQSQRSHGM